ncbi:MAG: hypothetical protein RR036_00685, partial [Oscillospiraceae bacterium]
MKSSSTAGGGVTELSEFEELGKDEDSLEDEDDEELDWEEDGFELSLDGGNKLSGSSGGVELIISLEFGVLLEFDCECESLRLESSLNTSLEVCDESCKTSLSNNCPIPISLFCKKSFCGFEATSTIITGTFDAPKSKLTLKKTRL